MLSEQISSAEHRLMEKLLKLDIQSLDISEYNQRYLGDRVAHCKGVLSLFGKILRLCIENSKVPLDNFVFIDYGGGSGVLSFLAKEMGIGTVIYNDIYDVSCNDMSMTSKLLMLSPDHIVCGDIDQLISYLHTNSIRANAIASWDVLEHIYDVELHFERLASLSNLGLTVVYGSTANIKNPWVARGTMKAQQEVEFQNREKVWGSKDRDTTRAYFDVRKEMIAEFAPDLDPDQVELLAQWTRGLRRDDIEKYIVEYKAKGFISYQPNHATNTCDPYTGNWKEHLMSTIWLEQILKKAGFSAKIYAGSYYVWSGSLPKIAVKLILNLAIQIFGKRALFISPHFILYANRSNKS